MSQLSSATVLVYFFVPLLGDEMALTHPRANESTEPFKVLETKRVTLRLDATCARRACVGVSRVYVLRASAPPSEDKARDGLPWLRGALSNKVIFQFRI